MCQSMRHGILRRRSHLFLCVGFGLATLATAARGQIIVNVVSNPPAVVGGTAFVCMVQVSPHPQFYVSGSIFSHDVVGVPISGLAFIVPASVPAYPVALPTLPVAEDTVVEYSILQLYPYSRTVVSSQVTVQTPRVADLTLDPGSPLVGGTTVTATVTLNGMAPAAGAVVDLWSSESDIVTLPSQVIVAPGDTTATFPVVVRPVDIPYQVGLHAHRAGDSHVTGVIVNPPSVEAVTLRQ